MLEVKIIPALQDNYMYLVRDTETETCGIIDPSDANIALQFINKLDKLDYILNTHHHWDHTNGNLAIKQHTGAQVVGNASDNKRIPSIDILLHDNFTFGAINVNILQIPGHTSGHIAFHFPQDNILFTGDCLFCAGCGKVFEGTYQQMYSSLQKLAKLPDNTLIYCGHEYTKNNVKFALTVEPNNKHLHALLAKSESTTCTMPSSIKQEKLINPFLRAESAEIKKSLNLNFSESNPENDLTIFIKLRKLKDSF